MQGGSPKWRIAGAPATLFVLFAHGHFPLRIGDFGVRSNKLQRPEARMAVAADDDVVVHRDAERLRDPHDLLRHADVGR